MVSVELDGNDSDSYGGNGDVIKSIDESDSTVLDLNTQGVDSDVPVFSPEKSPKKRKKMEANNELRMQRFARGNALKIKKLQQFPCHQPSG